MNYTSHVPWARLLLSEILAGNGKTDYEHIQLVVWGEDNLYLSVTDCSGFVNELIKKSYHLTNNDLEKWFGRYRPYASTYYKTIKLQRGFIKITNINKTNIGDFLVFYFPIHTRIDDDNTGHIMMVNRKPIQIIPTSPNVEKTKQWAVYVIDQTSTPHGTDDTRYISRNQKTTGLGSGYIRIYTNQKGEIVGYTWSLDVDSKFVSITKHPVIIGRIAG